MGSRQLKRYFESYQIKKKVHIPRRVNLIVDGTYFGKRKESFCVVVFRDPKRKENLWWKFCQTETTSVYLEGRKCLENLGYTILSITGDGFSGIRQAFLGIPFQMCHKHMQRLVIKGTTKKPQLEAGQVLLALVKTLPYTSEEIFKKRLLNYVFRYSSFLNEKSLNVFSHRLEYTHRDLKYAFDSLNRFFPFLFIFEQNNSIPNTSNSLEGFFRHLKRILNVHCGLGKNLKKKFIEIVIYRSTTSVRNVKI